MSCQKNILELPFSASQPAPTDVVIMTLADGSTVIRYWSALVDGLRPLGDLKIGVDGPVIDADGNTIGSGPASNQAVVTLPATWEGKRIRVYRGGPAYYQRFDAFNRTTDGFELTDGDVLQAGEWLKVENY